MNILVLCILAFFCLALAMERHQQSLFGRQLGRGMSKALRIVGWCLLSGSLAVVLYQPLWAKGLVAWFGCLSVGAGLVFVLLVVMERFLID